MSATNGTNYTVAEPSVSPIATRSVSDHTLKTLTHMDDSVVGRVNGNGKCESMAVCNGRRMPSYVGISCAISGYSDYNRYCSSVRNSCTRREMGFVRREPTPRPVNNLNDSLNRKNSLISEALITSRHNVNEDIEVNGSHQSIDSDNGLNSQLKEDLNNKDNNNSLLEQRIASLYGHNFAKDWRESRTKTRGKLNSSCIISKQRSPSCPPTQNTTTKPVQSSQHPTNDNKIDTHSNLISDRQSISSERLESEQTIEAKAAIDTTTNNASDKQQMAQSISNVENGSNGSNGCSSAQSKPSNAKDGNWFLNELNKTTEEIRSKIDLTEQMLEKEADSLNEDISGKLRAAIGKANLLINQKFNQFKELCLKNISHNDSEQFVTTNDDLEGFWDMVSIQVIDINDTFDEICKLRDIGWKNELLPKRATLTPTKVRSRKSTPKGSPDKSCDDSNADRESERRNRLREAKRKARLKASQNEDEITIFIPSNRE